MENNNSSKKGLLMLFMFCLFVSSNTFATDIIDMRTPQIENKVVETTPIQQTSELLLYNNYINMFNGEEFVSSIAPYYDNIVLSFDNYNITIYFNDIGIEKVVEGSSSNYDAMFIINKENVKYLVNNWYNMDTFDKIKYIINLDGVSLGQVVKLSGIAMSSYGKNGE